MDLARRGRGGLIAIDRRSKDPSNQIVCVQPSEQPRTEVKEW